MRGLLVHLNGESYAVRLDLVREVVPDPQVTPLLLAPPAFLGLFNLRGEVVPLLDTAILLDAGPMSAARFAVVVDSPGGPAALATTAFPEAANLDLTLEAGDATDTMHFVSVDGRVVGILDLDRLLAPGRIG